MTIFIRMEYTGWFAEMANRGRGFTTRAKNLILTESNREAVSWWHTKYIPPHFHFRARRVYRYQRRKKVYSAIKKKVAEGQIVFVKGEQVDDKIIKGGTVDIVRKGDAEDKAIVRVPIKATPRRAVAKIRVPGYISLRPRGGRPNMSKEVLTANQPEIRDINKRWAKKFMHNVRRYGQSAIKIVHRIGSK